MNSISNLKSIDMEIPLLAYRAQLPSDQRGPPPKPDPNAPRKPIQTYHIPKGAFADKPYLIGDPSQQGVVKGFHETGERITVNSNSNDIHDRMNVKDKLTK